MCSFQSFGSGIYRHHHLITSLFLLIYVFALKRIITFIVCRLEAGLCLYGNDIDENTTPVSAALAWTIGLFIFI